jgi:ATP-dependent DNA helicase RecG
MHQQLSITEIDDFQAQLLIQIGEGQFSEVKAKEIAPAKLTKTLSAFANSDGGDLYVGVAEAFIGGGVKQRSWEGFADVEAANGHIQSFERLFPLGTDFQYEFLSCATRQGLILHVQVNRTQAIMKADDAVPYIRRGAATFPVLTPESVRRLEYAKGVVSFENELVNASKETLTNSTVTARFLQHVVPTAEPEAWLRKQSLLRDDRPSVAGVLLMAEEPQAIIPKRCGVKVYRYKTQEAQGFRDVLAFNPITIEGCLYDQIRDAVSKTVEVTESIPKMGGTGLEKIHYPTETLHEIITNALIHRDYSIADDVHIRIFDNRIEIQSPGRLPAHVTVKKILDERFARNGAIVRLLNKFPDPPNKDVGEGLNTAFSKMRDLGLKEPQIEEKENDVLVIIRHETLASPEEAIMEFLEVNESIKNRKAREITGVKADYQMKAIFNRMQASGLIEQVPGTTTSSTAYRKINKVS